MCVNEHCKEIIAIFRNKSVHVIISQWEFVVKECGDKRQ